MTISSITWNYDVWKRRRLNLRNELLRRRYIKQISNKCLWLKPQAFFTKTDKNEQWLFNYDYKFFFLKPKVDSGLIQNDFGRLYDCGSDFSENRLVVWGFREGVWTCLVLFNYTLSGGFKFDKNLSSLLVSQRFFSRCIHGTTRCLLSWYTECNYVLFNYIFVKIKYKGKSYR